MAETKREIGVVGMAVAFWLAVYAILTSRSLAFMPEYTLLEHLDSAARRLVTCGFGFGLCLAMPRILDRAVGGALASRSLVAVALSVAAGFSYSIVNYLAFYVVLSDRERMSPVWVDIASNGFVLFWTFLAWCAFYYMRFYDHALRDRELRLAELQILAADAQNRMLRYQINPHFLFNTLNALSTLILDKENERAERMLLSLASFLRYSLDKNPTDKVPVVQEFETQAQYLRIEQIRFGDRMAVRQSVSPEAEGALMPSFLLQPLVENAVKHAVAVASNRVTIDVAAEVRGDRLVLQVVDDGPGLPSAAAGAGVGLENVRQRLKLMYGDAALTRSGSRDGGGFEVMLTLPLERA
jgi:signal transduction histidine kinase